MSQHQTSGSITLDLSSLTSAVAAALEPRLQRIEQAVQRDGTALHPEDAAEVVVHHLPEGLNCVVKGDFVTTQFIAIHLIEELARTGYRLTAIDGAALIHETQEVTSFDNQTVREERWFEPGREV